MSAAPPPLHFKNLPLIEVAVRLTLADQIPLTYKIVNGISKQLEGEFPLLTEPQHLEVPPGIEVELPITSPGLAGAILTGNNQGIRIGIQDRLIAVRWQKEGKCGPPYPRFDTMERVLKSAHAAMGSAIGRDPLKIRVVNMFYVNFIDLEHSEPVQSRFLSEPAQLEIMNDAKETQKLEASWRRQSGVDLRFNLQQAKRSSVDDEPVEGYKLTSAAGRLLLGETENAFDCLRELHETLLSFFAQLISGEAKALWGFMQ